MHPVKTLLRFAATVLSLLPFATGAGPILEDALLGQPILGGKLFVAESGNVQATFQGTDAAYTSDLYLAVPSAGGGTKVFDSGSAVGSTMDLGFFEAGTELVFMLSVRDTGRTYLSGAASRNADGVAHARAVTVFDSALDQYVTSLGFEDLYGGGDRDYNDFNFMLSNVIDPIEGEEDVRVAQASPVPEPGVLALLGGALLVLPVARRLGTR